MIDQKTIDEVFSTARIEEVIGDFVSLKRSGANYKGLSPFVDEKTPSFVVSPAKGIWKDFSSGKGGNVVTFLMELEHYSYPEAIRFVAKKYSIEIKEDAVSDEQKIVAQERESLYLVSEYAMSWFKEQLVSTSAGRNIGLSYFREREFSDHTIEKFALGYSPDLWNEFTDKAIAKGYKMEYLQSSGLTIVREDGKVFDRFKGRVMFPIHTFSGRVAGFGGRTLLKDKTVAKYLNSPESPIYHKSDILYGLYQAKNAIIKSDMCYLVEGYTDVISMHQAGIENVVASSGTALTQGQIRLIKRLTQNITVLYDGDPAGIRASFRGIDMLLEADMNVRVLTFPDGDDPDSFARKCNSSELKEYLLANQTDFINFKTQILLEDTKGDPILKSRLVRDIVVSVSKISDFIKREVYLKECSRLLGVSESTLFAELAQIDKKNYSEYQRVERQIAEQEALKERLSVHKNTVHQSDPFEHIERDIIRTILLYSSLEITTTELIEQQNERGDIETVKNEYQTSIAREIIESFVVDDIILKNAALADVLDQVKTLLSQNAEINISHFLKNPDPEKITLITELISDQHSLCQWERRAIQVKEFEDIASHYVKDLILRYKELFVSKNIHSLMESLKSELSAQEREDALAMIIRMNELRQRLNQNLGDRVV